MLLLAAIVPAWLFLAIIYAVDRKREKPQFVFLLYFIGMLIVLPAALAEKYLLDLYSQTSEPQTGFLATLVTAFFIAGAVEESLKAIAFKQLVYPRPFFDEPYDGVVYAVAIGLGFATVENVLYVLSSGLSTAFVRAFTAVPAHALFGVVMGAYFSRSKFQGSPMWPAFVVPALLHGIYDSFALAQSYFANLLLVVYLMWLVRFAYTRAYPLLHTKLNYRIS
ncbi:PrsW family glutamic-type intramembrane protease [Sulfoacidibacillus thermotolerans]|uniref:Protease PrsW n=1 Tax=Sulfoacidibacillus thermotolerans TaxID=1765684 RepID=A0A2U3DCQ3_SULT2|nr:PrsW family glutamic-type intramembrane protease [Sulfoacidibacillus thermotolerans]PWI59042.1 hypothetical protein BM613_00040 [Sulfoacidibacillus thermotolerans]